MILKKWSGYGRSVRTGPSDTPISGTGVGSTHGTVPGPVRPNKDPPKKKQKKQIKLYYLLRIVPPCIGPQYPPTEPHRWNLPVRTIDCDSWLFSLQTDLCNTLCQSQPLPPNRLYWGVQTMPMRATDRRLATICIGNWHL